MSDSPTLAEFQAHLHETFTIQADGDRSIELVLDQIKVQERQPKGYECFSVTFECPEDIYLEQAIYALQHPVLGAREIFLVPSAPEKGGASFEAVFNRKL